MTASSIHRCMLLCPVGATVRGDFPHFSPSCKCWIIYLPANSQHCQHPVVKIYLCPDKCSGGLRSNYSLLPDILLDAVPVYTTVNHRLPITFLHKTRPVFKSQGRGQLKICPGCVRVGWGGARGEAELVSSFNAYSIFLFIFFWGENYRCSGAHVPARVSPPSKVGRSNVSISLSSTKESKVSLVFHPK